MTTVKTPVDRKQAEQLLNDLIKQFNTFGTSSTTPSQHDLEKYFTNNLVVVNNEKTLIHNINDLITQIRGFQNEFSNASYTKQQDSFLVDGNKLSVHYNIDLTTKGGKKTQFQASANFTIEGGKIAKIEQIIHEKGATYSYNPSK